MNRAPLPADHQTAPRSVADIMVILKDQVGLPLRDLIELDLQTLHDLLIANISSEDEALAHRIVIVDDDTIAEVDRIVTAAIGRARRDRRIAETGYEGWTSRARAVEALGPDHAGKPLSALDAAICARHGCDEVVLEDEDYQALFAAMNTAISARPHGRSPRLDRAGESDEDAIAAAARSFTAAHRQRAPSRRADDGHEEGDNGSSGGVEPELNGPVVNSFVTATMIAMGRRFPPDIKSSPRPVTFLAVRSGVEKKLLPLAQDEDEDLICLGFEPGAEHEGPVNVAVYEERGGEVVAWTECDPWTFEDGFFAIRAKGGEIAFLWDGRSLVALWDTPSHGVAEAVVRGRTKLRQIAKGQTQV